MSEYHGKRGGGYTPGPTAPRSPQLGTPGKQTLAAQAYESMVQRRADPSASAEAGAAHPAAAAGEAAPAQSAGRTNQTGLPDNLKSGIESMSGVSMDDVKVHYNSAEPGKLNALAFAQGSDIHVAPGQEQHVPHEAWHVVQQAQGRVKPTTQLKQGMGINDDHALEHEADVMGARALQSGGTQAAARSTSASSAGATVQTRRDSSVAQLVLATVNPQNGPVHLHQIGGAPPPAAHAAAAPAPAGPAGHAPAAPAPAGPAPAAHAPAAPAAAAAAGGGGFAYMQNPTQPDGREVSDEVGFTGILNEADWAGLGKSPKDHWRAHGYAKSFGGAGDITNVGWWAADAEGRWTDHEQKVRGAGQGPVPGWTPGFGEQGTYQVDRQMHPTTLFVQRYIDDVMLGVHWGFDDTRPAWQRALASCNKLPDKKAKEKRVALLVAEKARVSAANQQRITNWVTALFGGANSVETNLIARMAMTYQIATPGVGPGPSRANVSQYVTSARPDPSKFGLQNKPPQIWAELVNRNAGVFSSGNPPAQTMNGRVPYPGNAAAQELRAFADGFGIG